MTLTPGPMLEQSDMLRKYIPLELDGLAFFIAPITTLKFSNNFSSSKLTLPITVCKLEVVSF